MVKPLFVIGVILLSACAVTGPAQDSWDEEEAKPKIAFDNPFNSSESGKIGASESGDLSRPSVANEKNLASDYREFLDYRAWIRERESNSELYQEFKQYLQWEKLRGNVD